MNLRKTRNQRGYAWLGLFLLSCSKNRTEHIQPAEEPSTRWYNVELPSLSIRCDHPLPGGRYTVVSVKEDGVRVGRKASVELRLPPREQRQNGFEAMSKRDGINGLYLPSLGEAIQKDMGDEKSLHSVIFAIDEKARVPSQILLELLYTASQHGASIQGLAWRSGDTICIERIDPLSHVHLVSDGSQTYMSEVFITVEKGKMDIAVRWFRCPTRSFCSAADFSSLQWEFSSFSAHSGALRITSPGTPPGNATEASPGWQPPRQEQVVDPGCALGENGPAFVWGPEGPPLDRIAQCSRKLRLLLDATPPPANRPDPSVHRQAQFWAQEGVPYAEQIGILKALRGTPGEPSFSPIVLVSPIIRNNLRKWVHP